MTDTVRLTDYYLPCDTVPAGPQLDALVATFVMGITWDETRCRVCGWPLGADVISGCVPENCSQRPVRTRRADQPAPYSTDIAAAWKVIEHLRDQWTVATAGLPGSSSGAPCDPDFIPPFDDNAFFERLHRSADRRWPWAMLYLTPESICRAALAAVEDKTRG